MNMKKQSSIAVIMVCSLAWVCALIGLLGSAPAQAAVPSVPSTAPASPLATTWVVTSSADSGAGTLRAAIATAVPGDTITFASDMTITLSSELIISQSLTIDGEAHAVTVSGNHATRVFNVTGGNVTFAHLTIADGNVQTTDCGPLPAKCGGGIIVQSDSVAVTVTESALISNSAVQFGGGIFIFSGTLTIQNSTLSHNSGSLHAGGVYNYYGVVTVISSTFTNNVAAPNGGLYSGHGGGIDNNFGRLTVINSAFYSNTAYGGGGGIYTASAPGACNDTSAVTVTNSTFSGNSVLSSTAGSFNSAGYGGGIYNGGGVLEINSSTIVSNAAPLGGSGLGSYNDSGTCTRVGSSLIAGNSGSDVSEDTSPPVQRFASLGYNVIGLAGNNVDFTLEFTHTQDMTNVVNPLVAPLANNGGGLSTGSGWTHALLPGSPAIDHAGMTCPATDQRGIPRPQGAACDSGAYESRGFSLAKSRGDNQSAAINAAFVNPLNVTLNELGGNVLPGATITFTAPMSGASIVPPTTITTSTNANGVAILPVTANSVIGSYAVTATASSAGVVTFTLTNLPVYTLIVNTVGNGAVTRIPDQTDYVSGTIVILTATPSTTYTFTGWSGDLTYNINPNLIVMNANKVVTATFMTPPTNLSAANDSPTPIGQATTLSATTVTGLNVTYQWDFGDGNTAVGAQVSHRYGLTGWYTAAVTATNGAGSISTTTRVLIDRMKIYLPLIRH